MAAPHPIEPRAQVRDLFASQIRAVANAAIGRSDVLPFWFGESDERTPSFIVDEAVRALRAGDTFYTPNLGLPELRVALAGHVGRLHGPVDPGRIAVTASGMSALMITLQALVAPGDRVVVVTPVWPNLPESARILSARVERVGLECVAGAWRLDCDRLLAALTPDTRVLLINSPNNPTGWVIDPGHQRAVLERCRRHGIWVVADDVYERLVFDPDRIAAPSFLAIAEHGDRIISTNSFSKSWLMTGWRLGWIVAPSAPEGAGLIPALGTLIEYNTSCAPGFVQRAALRAVQEGDPVVARTRSRLDAAAELLCGRLSALPDVQLARPLGAMYLFFRPRAGSPPSFDLARRLVAEAGVGLAPGSAFGPEGEGYLRWCIASSLERIDQGADRFLAFMRGAGAA